MGNKHYHCKCRCEYVGDLRAHLIDKIDQNKLRLVPWALECSNEIVVFQLQNISNQYDKINIARTALILTISVMPLKSPEFQKVKNKIGCTCDLCNASVDTSV